MADEPERSSDYDEEEDARAFILARRARFVRAALAGAALTTVACDCGPQVCLEPAQPPGTGGSTGAAEAYPQPCLIPMLQETGDAGGSAGTASHVDGRKGAATSGSAGGGPK